MPDDQEATEVSISENMHLLLNRLSDGSLAKKIVQVAAETDGADWETTIEQLVEARLESWKESVVESDEA